MQRALTRSAVLPFLAPRLYSSPAASAFTAAQTTSVRGYASKKKSSKQQSEPAPKKTTSKGHQMMPEDIEAYNTSRMEKNMQDHIERLRINLKSVVGRVGTASADLLDSVKVTDESGERFRLTDFAHVAAKDASTLHVNLYDPEHTGLVERALGQAKIPLSPVRISKSVLQVKVSRPDQALREKLAREAAGICEAARTTIRNDRHKAQKAIKKAVDQSMSKNEAAAEAKQLDETTAAHTKTVDQIAAEAKKILLDD